MDPGILQLPDHRVSFGGQQHAHARVAPLGVNAGEIAQNACIRYAEIVGSHGRSRLPSVRQGAQYKSVFICRLLILGSLIPRDLGIFAVRAEFGVVLAGIVVANIPIDAYIIVGRAILQLVLVVAAASYRTCGNATVHFMDFLYWQVAARFIVGADVTVVYGFCIVDKSRHNPHAAYEFRIPEHPHVPRRSHSADDKQRAFSFSVKKTVFQYEWSSFGDKLRKLRYFYGFRRPPKV